MSSPPHEPRPPLLQTVCHAGLLTLAALMADQVHQLPHLGLSTFQDLPLRQPSVRITDQESLYTKELDEGPTKEQDPEEEPLTNSSKGKDLPNEGDEVKPLELLCAPIYSFDEDGDILQCIETTPFTETPSDAQKPKESTATPYDTLDIESTQMTSLDVLTEQNNGIQTKEEGNEDASSCSHPILASVGTAEEAVPHIDTPKDTPEPVVPSVARASNPLTVTPKIKLHAGSVEVEDDYLEGHLDQEHHLRDFYATLLGECSE